MLNLFSGSRTEHPMANAQRASEIIAGLPSDSAKALTEIAGLIESVHSTESLRLDRRLEAILLLDESAQRHLRRATRDYVAMLDNEIHESRFWLALHEFYARSTEAFLACLDEITTGAKGAGAAKGHLHSLAVRCLRSIGGLQKWLALRYGRLDEIRWRQACAIFNLAVRAQFAEQRIAPYPKFPTETAIAHEFLRIVAFAASSPGSLLPAEMDAADHLIASVVDDVRLEAKRSASGTHWIDLAGERPPARRVARLEATASTRYLALASAAAKLESLQGAIVFEGRIPETAQLPEYCSVENVVAAAKHLCIHWSDEPLARRHPRVPMKQRIEIGHGFDRAIETLSGGSRQEAELDFSAPASISTWVTEDIGAGGFGARVLHPNFRLLRVRCLLAVQVEGSAGWSIAVVLRLERHSADEFSVDTETLTRTPAAVTVLIDNDGILSSQGEPAILLAPPQADHDDFQILLRSGVHAPEQSFEFESNGGRFHLYPQQVLLRGPDYELIRCRIASLA